MEARVVSPSDTNVEAVLKQVRVSLKPDRGKKGGELTKFKRLEPPKNCEMLLTISMCNIIRSSSCKSFAGETGNFWAAGALAIFGADLRFSGLLVLEENNSPERPLLLLPLLCEEFSLSTPFGLTGKGRSSR